MTFLLIQILAGILVGAALIVAVSDICVGLKPNLRRAYRRGFASGRLFSTYFLFVLVVLLGYIFLIIPGLVLVVWYMFTFPATVLEQLSGRAALRRSRELGRGFYWRNLGVAIVAGLLVSMVLLVAGFLIGLAEYLLLGGSYRMLESILAEALSIILYGPLISIPLILLYYDMRARKERYGAVQLVEDLRI